MIAEQNTSCTYWVSDALPGLEIQESIRIEIPGEEGGYVTTYLQYEPKLPESLWDVLHRHLYDGVHGGLAAAGLPLPSERITVRIMRLSIIPSLDDRTATQTIEAIGSILEHLTREMVHTLRIGLANLSVTLQP
jgi:hypothetical protein